MCQSCVCDHAKGRGISILRVSRAATVKSSNKFSTFVEIHMHTVLTVISPDSVLIFCSPMVKNVLYFAKSFSQSFLFLSESFQFSLSTLTNYITCFYRHLLIMYTNNYFISYCQLMFANVVFHLLLFTL